MDKDTLIWEIYGKEINKLVYYITRLQIKNQIVERFIHLLCWRISLLD